jgi:hypothetical protein
LEILAINYAMEMSPMIDHYIASLRTVVIESKYVVAQLFGVLVLPYHDVDVGQM